MKYFICLLFLCLMQSCSVSQKILPFDTEQTSPTASIEQVSWISGHWKGEAFGGITEEVWTKPLGGSMMGSFKLVSEGKVNFYEILTISEVDQTLVLRLKHFHGDLKGWEEKDEVQEFKLVKMKKGAVYFDNFTFEKITDDHMVIHVLIGSDDGTEELVAFPYYKINDL